jgi:hypothetical protein
MVIADYASVCVQFYCILVFTVFHYIYEESYTLEDGHVGQNM